MRLEILYQALFTRRKMIRKTIGKSILKFKQILKTFAMADISIKNKHVMSNRPKKLVAIRQDNKNRYYDFSLLFIYKGVRCGTH